MPIVILTRRGTDREIAINSDAVASMQPLTDDRGGTHITLLSLKAGGSQTMSVAESFEDVVALLSN